MNDKQDRSELARLWSVIRSEPGEWIIIVPYLVPFLVAVLQLYDVVTILFYAVTLPVYTGYATGYLIVWYPLRHREDAYVRFAASFCAFNLILLYVATSGIHRVQVILLVGFVLTGYVWERRKSR